MSYLDHLRSFLAVHRLSSVTAAARSLGITQPAVTGHIKALESRVGRPLFERAGRGIVPTVAADTLARRVGVHLDALEHSLEAVAMRGDDSAGIVTIGGPAEFMTEVALPVLAPVTEQRITIHARYGYARELIERLETTELDLVIASQRIPRATISYERVFRENFLLVGSPRFRHMLELLEETSAIVSRLEAAPWVAYDADLPIIRRFFRTGLHHEPGLSRVSTAPDLRSVMRLVAAGAGISVLPDYLCVGLLASGDIVELWRPAVLPANDLWIATRKGGRNRRTAIVIDLLRQLAGP